MADHSAAYDVGSATSTVYNDAHTTVRKTQHVSAKDLFRSLSWGDRLLAPAVLGAMILGVGLGNAIPEAKLSRVFDAGSPGSTASWQGVSIRESPRLAFRHLKSNYRLVSATFPVETALMIGLLVMIWPAMSKVQWEAIPDLFRSRSIYIHLGISLVLNWIVAPFVMAACAWIALPEASLDRERRGVLLVGVARCIAMVIIWTGIAQGDTDYCAILVVANSLLQIVLFSPYAVLFCNYLGVRAGSDLGPLKLAYSQVAKSVGIYLGIPLAAGAVTRALVLLTLRPKARARFFNYFGPLGEIGLLYVIIVLFTNQGRAIIHNIGTVVRICVPLIMYFTIVWTVTFYSFYKFSRSKYGAIAGGYEKAVTQAFTAGSNNFEIAIAIAVASFGGEVPETLAATLGPLIEVPVLLCLSYVALYLRDRMDWALDAAVNNAIVGGHHSDAEARIGRLASEKMELGSARNEGVNQCRRFGVAV
ncbi:BZ3500_MvSof-1268-A1-R1_Chr1-3g02096 [Microbotryum saponariae]|uniref:BZ3500_MvSof-1268-A1-R1_Chr1-3g02096 protein n=1 Tax=Microbotryum saponariae TaxID=289078 RepID=A0A2X0KSY7_9BASI|nr:BZ3500_MvSof-1268-A1-R1_Chr1-3g02096 [Microbotryum saponariae]SCZ95398.1 BZ3501_MvSof-1269-A2-R1_Chr1-3g01698 [Microbotryum saponariae]